MLKGIADANNDPDHIEEIEEEEDDRPRRRERDADDDGSLQDTPDPSIFSCSEEKPTYFYLDLLGMHMVFLYLFRKL